MKQLVVWLGVAAIAACGRGRGGGDGIAASPIELDEYCDRWAAMACQDADACGCLDQFGVGPEGCAIFVRAECADEVDEPVRSGARSFHPAEAGRCLAGVHAVVSDCAIDDGDEYPDACDEMMVGQRAEAEPCESTSDCVPGLECMDSGCVRLPREGESCGTSGCASEAFCGDDGLCHSYRGRGEACPEGGMACGTGLYCDERTQTCEPYLGRGESCGHASWACNGDLTCAADMTCQPYPGEGEPCAPAGICAGDLFCNAGSICREPSGDGEPCAESRECASYECDGGACVGEPEEEEEDGGDSCDLL